MKKALWMAMLPTALALWAFFQAAPVEPGLLAGYCPAGAALYIEARDLGALLRDWKASPEKRLWLGSANYEVFSRSRLFGRLERVQEEFAAAGGVAPDMNLLEAAAGTESALAIYDIGQLELLYVTRLASARAIETALWKARTKFEPRNAGGQAYYVRIDPASRRVVAFAAANDLLLLATREDLMAGALMQIAGQGGAAVKSEGWFAQAAKAAGPAGELRMALNMQALARSAHFRSYWIQRNVSALRPFSAAMIDAHRSAAGIREERVLLRAGDSPAVSEAAVAQILRLAPEDAGFYRAMAAPDKAQAAAVIVQKILNPRQGGPAESRYAPTVSTGAAEAGRDSDLETRIDEPPLVLPGFNPEPLRRALEATTLEAMLEAQWSRVLPDGIFVDNEPVVALLASSDWDVNAVRAALAATNEGRWGTGFAVAAQGRTLVIARSETALNAVASRFARPPAAQGAAYAAGYRHARELANFTRMMKLIDYPAIDAAPGQEIEGRVQARQPEFFSENLASLGRVLNRVKFAAITVHDRGQTVTQTVVYSYQ